MKNILKTFVFLTLFLSVFCFFVIEKINASIADYQILGLNPGWNIISTPKVLSSHEFSVAETSANFDIFLLDPTTPSGWQTIEGAGQTDFQPLFAYFVNNKTGQNQTLRFNYNLNLTPVQRLFQRTLNLGWNTVGIASPSYALPQGSTSADINNPTSILNSITNSIAQVVDFTNGNTNLDSPSISGTWLSKTVADANMLNDFRELKGYGVFVTSATNNYLGSQDSGPSSPLTPTISGESTVCKLDIETYTTEAGKTNYVWIVVGGTKIAGGGNTNNTITVKWTASGSRTVKVTYEDPNYSESGTAVFPVTVGQIKPGIIGPSVSTLNTTGTYRTEDGQSNYVWTVSSGGTITEGGDGSDSVTVLWNEIGNQFIELIYTPVPDYGCSFSSTTFPVPVLAPVGNPDLVTSVTLEPNIMHGVTNVNISIKISEILNVPTNGLITVLVPKDSRWTIGSIDNLAWSYEDSEPFHKFTSTTVIPGGGSSIFNIPAVWDGGATQGFASVTAQITSGSGGEINGSNNTDAERFDYFIN